MTPRIAFALALLTLAALVVDQIAFSGAATLFLLRKLADFIQYAAFWRR